MQSKNLKRALISAFMALVISHAPQVIASEKMISAASVLAEQNRSDAEKNVLQYMQKTQVQKALVANGVSSDEASLRLASLSDQELRQLSGQVTEARAGGDILIAILLVVLIIYFAKRI